MNPGLGTWGPIPETTRAAAVEWLRDVRVALALTIDAALPTVNFTDAQRMFEAEGYDAPFPADVCWLLRRYSILDRYRSRLDGDRLRRAVEHATEVAAVLNGSRTPFGPR